jgi:hypothetical protein
MNVFKNIFGRRKKWNKEHIEYWKDELKLRADGYSKFQSDLFSLVKSELTDLKIEFSTETTNHESLSNRSITVKMITLTLNSLTASKIWIYHDMAEYDLMQTHHIFEEWGYLKPDDLSDAFISSMKKEIKKLHTTKPIRNAG